METTQGRGSKNLSSFNLFVQLFSRYSRTLGYPFKSDGISFLIFGNFGTTSGRISDVHVELNSPDPLDAGQVSRLGGRQPDLPLCHVIPAIWQCIIFGRETVRQVHAGRPHGNL